MVTVDDDQCMKLDEEAEVCLDGTTPDGTPPAYESDSASASSYRGDYGYRSGAHLSWVYLFVLLSAWFFVAVLEI